MHFQYTNPHFKVKSYLKSKKRFYAFEECHTQNPPPAAFSYFSTFRAKNIYCYKAKQRRRLYENKQIFAGNGTFYFRCRNASFLSSTCVHSRMSACFNTFSYRLYTSEKTLNAQRLESFMRLYVIKPPAFLVPILRKLFAK